VLGIDWNEPYQRRVLSEFFPRHYPSFDYPDFLEDHSTLDRFYTMNSQFGWLDCRALFVLLMEWKPRRIIEVGSGYSTLLAADVNQRFLDGRTSLTCIEPHPRPFLTHAGGLPRMTKLLVERVERVGLAPFAELDDGDVLFIDSSHVAKTGSDVNFLVFEVLPRLRPGVHIHFHDVFLPGEYPHEWVLAENRSWNEQYVIRALLMFSNAFRVLFGSMYASLKLPDLVRAALGDAHGRPMCGGSLWIRREATDLYGPVGRRIGEHGQPWQMLNFGGRPQDTVVDPCDTATAEPQGISRSVDYDARAAEETERFERELVVHDLPAIYHYWSNKYLRPMVEQEFGFSHPEAFFAKHLVDANARKQHTTARFLSIGAGNCDTEIAVARLLREAGVTNFTLDCLDLTPAMLERGRQAAAEARLEGNLRFIPGDFNTWRAEGGYDAIMAHQSLHHVVALEHLFDAIHAGLTDNGLFLASDMIGRNGHQFWPEALAIVQDYWSELPPWYRFNVMLRRDEPVYLNWDCSVEGFEGVRAQDILPLLIEHFGFEVFVAFGNVIDAFIGRCFGPHFDANRDWDRSFIDRVHLRDEAEILSGSIKPTHLMAVMRRDPSVQPRVWKHLTPDFCVRRA
jgi:SAM-dependent methyltransferase